MPHQWNFDKNILVDRTNIKTKTQVVYVLFELLEVRATYRRPPQDLATVPCWNISIWSPAFSLGVGTLNLLHVPRPGAMDSWCHDSQRLGSKSRIFHRVLLCIERFESIWSRIHVECERPATGVQAWPWLAFCCALNLKRPTKFCLCSCFWFCLHSWYRRWG